MNGVIEPWESDREFDNLMAAVSRRTVVDRVRCFMLHQIAGAVSISVPGDVAEVGVWRGGTAAVIASAVRRKASKTIHLFDTFSGMPESDPSKDFHKAGDFSDVSQSEVASFLSAYGNFDIHAGVFPGTASTLDGIRFSFVHVDADIYKSVMDCCVFFYPRVSKGGIIVFDDYGFQTCHGAKMAVDEYFSDRRDPPIYLPTGQCMIIKSE